MRTSVLLLLVAFTSAGCQSHRESVSGARSPAEANYSAVASLASGKWQATPLKLGAGRPEPVAVELSFSPMAPPPAEAQPAGPYPIGTVTITTSAWVARAHVYDIARTEGDQFFEPGFLVDASESESVPLNLSEAPEWSFIVSDAHQLTGITRGPGGSREASNQTKTQPKLDICWETKRADG